MLILLLRLRLGQLLVIHRSMLAMLMESDLFLVGQKSGCGGGDSLE
jgi:hypothetical protein